MEALRIERGEIFARIWEWSSKELFIRVRIDKTDPFYHKFLAEIMVIAAVKEHGEWFYVIAKSSYSRSLEDDKFSNPTWLTFYRDNEIRAYLDGFFNPELDSLYHFKWEGEPWVLLHRPVVAAIKTPVFANELEVPAIQVVPLADAVVLSVLARLEGVLSTKVQKDPMEERLRMTICQRLGALVDQKLKRLSRTTN